jgi:putative membrane protein
MFRMLIHWLLSAIALMAVANLVPGFYVNDFWSAMLAAVVIGFLNATLGFVMKVVSFPLVLLTFGIFLFFINAAMIKIASNFVSGFYVYTWGAAFWGGIVLSLLGLIIRAVMKDQ